MAVVWCVFVLRNVFSVAYPCRLLPLNRAEGIYHAYNLLTLGSDTAEISYLYPMLEGQVSVLSSGRVKGEEAAALFKSMYASSMYRKDQHTFMLYPDRKLKGFMERNKIPAEKIDSPAVKYCLEQKLTKILYKVCFVGEGCQQGHQPHGE